MASFYLRIAWMATPQPRRGQGSRAPVTPAQAGPITAASATTSVQTRTVRGQVSRSVPPLLARFLLARFLQLLIDLFQGGGVGRRGWRRLLAAKRQCQAEKQDSNSQEAASHGTVSSKTHPGSRACRLRAGTGR